MPIFTDEEMQEFADTLEELGMPSRCIIRRPSVNNGQATLTLIGETDCLAFPPAPNMLGQAVYEDFRGNLLTWPVFLPLHTDVQEGDVLTIEGQDMTVQANKSPRSFAVYEEVLASGVKG